MADPRKNPLLGAFRSPGPSDPPPGKPDEDKKPAEPPKEVKAPTAPAKPGEVKKPAEPPKDGKEQKPTEGEKKAPEGKAPAAPAKPGEDKKPAEPPKDGKEQKPADGEKKAPEGKAPPAPAKPSEDKKPAEPPKDGKEQKPTEGEKKAPEGKAPAAPAKPGEDKKPTEPPKDGKEQRPAEGEDIPTDLKLEILSTSKMGTETMIPIDLIDDFEGHPFAVKDDKDMEDLVASVKQAGILEPVTIIRNPKKPGRFEMVSGHRRKHAANLAGLTHIRAFVRDMDHDEAIIAMVDSNLKRDKISPMEKARAYQMKSDALKRKAGRRTKEEAAALKAAGIKPKTTDEIIAEQTGESVASVQRTKTLTKLTEPMQKLVDSGDLPVNTAVDIAQMKPAEQDKLADAIEKEGGKVPSGTKAKELKEESKAGTLTDKKIEAAVAPTKREVDPPLKVTLTDEELRPYFPKGATLPDVKRVIFEALDLRKRAIEKQKAKVTAEKGAAKKAPAPAR